MSNLVISVLMSAYNSELYIKQAIESMYMTKQGFRKKVQIDSNDTFRN